MSQNNRIKVSELEFDSIKQNLRNFLEVQDEFSDYNYEGSALSVLLDILAYNTHYNALYTNMSINEMFLDSASKRSSVVSIANNFGYTPRSARSAVATLSFRVPRNAVTITPPPENLIIPKNTSFSSKYNDTTIVFKTLEDYISSPLNNNNTVNTNDDYYYFNDVKIYEGTYKQVILLCSKNDQKFIISAKNLDTSTLKVKVQKTTESSDIDNYVYASTIIDLTPESKIFFLKELDTGEYELSFGRSNLGVPIEAGNVITLSFMEPQYFDKANSLKVFTLNNLSFNPGQITATTVATGGSTRESNDEIKDNVTRFFFDQNRAVTAKDYSAIINREYPDVDSIFVWGGEKETPPQYGKVFISLKPKSKNILSDSEKDYIKDLLKPYQVVSSIIEFKDPSFINMKLDVTTTYDKSSTNISAETLKTNIFTIIEKYRQDNLQKHDGLFSLSNIMSNINDIDLAVVSTSIVYNAIMTTEPIYNLSYNYKFNFSNQIDMLTSDNVRSSIFYIDSSSTKYFIKDDQLGNLKLFEINITNDTSDIVKTIGSVNYDTGIILINNLTITRIDGIEFQMFIKPKSFDVISRNNNIIDIPQSLVTVTLKDKNNV